MVFGVVVIFVAVGLSNTVGMGVTISIGTGVGTSVAIGIGVTVCQYWYCCMYVLVFL